MGITFPVTAKMAKTTIFLVLLSLLYQSHAAPAPQDAAAAEPAEAAAEPAADAAAESAAEPAAEPASKAWLYKKAQDLLDKTDTVIVAKLTALADCPTKVGTATISCKTAPDADAPAPEAPVEVEGFPVDKALMADADVTEVLTLLRERNCKKFKRTLLAIMVNKKVVDAATTCQEEMVKIVDKDDGAADAAAEPAAEAAAETATEAPA